MHADRKNHAMRDPLIPEIQIQRRHESFIPALLFISGVSAMTLFILFAGTAGAGIVRIDLGAFDDRA